MTGTSDGAAGGLLTVTTSTESLGTTTTMSFSGQAAQSGGTLVIRNTDNSGAGGVATSTGTLSLGSGTTTTGSAILRIQPASTLPGSGATLTSGGTLTLGTASDLTFADRPSGLPSGTIVLAGDGTLAAGNTGTIKLRPATSGASTVAITGSPITVSSGTLSLSKPGDTLNMGNLVVNSGSAALTINNPSSSRVGHTISPSSLALWGATVSVSDTVFGGPTAAGNDTPATTSLDAGATVAIKRPDITLANSGVINLGGGALTLNPGGTTLQPSVVLANPNASLTSGGTGTLQPATSGTAGGTLTSTTSLVPFTPTYSPRLTFIGLCLIDSNGMSQGVIYGSRTAGTSGFTFAPADGILPIPGGFAQTIPMPIAGTLGLKKTGSGAATLTCDNTYTGNTIVEAGTLQVDRGINSNGTAADDTIVGAGVAPATLITDHVRQDTLTINSGAKVVIGNPADVSSTSVVNFLQIANGAGGYTWNVPTDAPSGDAPTAGLVSAVPEPATWVLVLVAAVAGIAAWRRR